MRRKPEEYNVLETKEVKYQGGGGAGEWQAGEGAERNQKCGGH